MSVKTPPSELVLVEIPATDVDDAKELCVVEVGVAEALVLDVDGAAEVVGVLACAVVVWLVAVLPLGVL